jgi:hypothetical protein
VSSVDDSDLGQFTAFGDGDHGGGDDAERQIDVGLHKLCQAGTSSFSNLAMWKPPPPNDLRNATSAGPRGTQAGNQSLPVQHDRKDTKTRARSIARYERDHGIND